MKRYTLASKLSKEAVKELHNRSEPSRSGLKLGSYIIASGILTISISWIPKVIWMNYAECSGAWTGWGEIAFGISAIILAITFIAISRAYDHYHGESILLDEVELWRDENRDLRAYIRVLLDKSGGIKREEVDNVKQILLHKEKREVIQNGDSVTYSWKTEPNPLRPSEFMSWLYDDKIEKTLGEIQEALRALNNKRKFAGKEWNAARIFLTQLGAEKKVSGTINA